VTGRPADTDEIQRLLTHGVVDVQVRDDLERKLRAGRQLRVKMGFDPSRPDIHIGHYVGFKKLREFQELGHTIVVIIGDWTAQIGDPTDRSAARTMLSAEEVRANAQTYMEQFFKVIDVERAEVAWQSSWFGDFGLERVIDLTSKYTVARMLTREDFARRYEAGSAIAITEFLYPLLQAYDSVAVRADVEMGGTDQTFNLLVGRDIQKEYGLEPQNIVTVPLLVGLDGEKKMSKSLDNYVGVTEDPVQSFGKLMSIPDSAIETYLRLVTDLPDAEIDTQLALMRSGALNPRDLKDRMAWEIVCDLHGRELADNARAEFARVFRAHELPEEMDDVAVTTPAPLYALIVAAGMAGSNNEARRLVTQGGVRLNGARIEDADRSVTLTEPTVLQVGRRRFARLLPHGN
jgi:tyrosyl-tRNA synthetase